MRVPVRYQLLQLQHASAPPRSPGARSRGGIDSRPRNRGRPYGRREEIVKGKGQTGDRGTLNGRREEQDLAFNFYSLHFYSFRLLLTAYG
jgi:hypothetical protein